MEGERDYYKITSHNGPLVYPAGHVFLTYLFRQIELIQGDLDLL